MQRVVRLVCLGFIAWSFGIEVIILLDSAYAKESRARQAVTESEPAKTPDLNPRPGQDGHRYHETFSGRSSPTALQNLKVRRTLRPPQGFIGNLTYDPTSNRLWLVSLGPPTNQHGPSMLYELNPKTGDVLAQAELPLRGDFGEPVYIDGYLYQGVFHESRIYKIDVQTSRVFGRIEKVMPIPTINDLKLVNEKHPFPFIEFGGVTATPDKHILFHADDVAELITIDRETGAILKRVRTLKAMGGMTGATLKNGKFIVLANSDPKGGYCALEFPPSTSRSSEQKNLSWVLVDSESGEAVASLHQENSPAYASTLSLVKHEEIEGAPYGRFIFLAMGEAGILEMEWTPEKDAF